MRGKRKLTNTEIEDIKIMLKINEAFQVKKILDKYKHVNLTRQDLYNIRNS